DSVVFTVEYGSDWLPLSVPFSEMSTPRDVEAAVRAAVDAADAERPPRLEELVRLLPEAAPAFMRVAVSTGEGWSLPDPPDLVICRKPDGLEWDSPTGAFTEATLEQLHRHLTRLLDYIG